MLRVLGVSAALFVLGSAARASEHYVEIWNPPEARLAKPTAPGKSHAGKTALIAHNMAKASPHKVADPLAKATPVKHAGSDLARKSAAPSAGDLPRIITPEGNVLRVSGGTMPVSVAR